MVRFCDNSKPSQRMSVLNPAVIQLAIASPSVDDSAVMNDPQATSIMTTGQVQCFNSESDVSSKVP